MKIGKYEIQPVLLYLPDEPEFVKAWEDCKQHLSEKGIDDCISFPGIYGKGFGIVGTHTYELDNPNGGHMIGQKYTAGFLSQYVFYNIANVLPNTHVMFMEPDNRFNDNWREELEKALEIIDPEFDFLFCGSCCAIDKNPIPVKAGGNLFKYPKTSGYPARYPLGGNCYIVAKKAIPHILATQRDAYAPADINLALHSFPQMDVYAILPRISEQFNNPLPL